MLDNTEGTVKNGKCIENGNIGYTKRKQKQNHNTLCVGRHYAQTNIYNVYKTQALIQTIT
jgi:hypothetical protein